MPTPGGPTKQMIGARQLVAGQLAHGDVLDDPLLDLFQPVVVLVEDARGLVEVEPVLGLDRPRQLGQPLQVGADDADLRRERMLLLQPLDLDERLGLDLLRHAGGFDLLAELAGDALFGASLRPVPSGWRASARAGSTRAAAGPSRPGPRSGSAGAG